MAIKILLELALQKRWVTDSHLHIQLGVYSNPIECTAYQMDLLVYEMLLAGAVQCKLKNDSRAIEFPTDLTQNSYLVRLPCTSKT